MNSRETLKSRSQLKVSHSKLPENTDIVVGANESPLSKLLCNHTTELLFAFDVAVESSRSASKPVIKLTLLCIPAAYYASALKAIVLLETVLTVLDGAEASLFAEQVFNVDLLVSTNCLQGMERAATSLMIIRVHRVGLT